MKKFYHKLFVRYAETDKLGIVYYANYLVWFEAARSDFLRNIGLPYSKIEKMGIFLPVVEAYCKYKAPAYYEDEIIIETSLVFIKNASMKIGYKVIREKDKKLLAEGYTIHSAINNNGKIIRIPLNIKSILQEFLN